MVFTSQTGLKDIPCPTFKTCDAVICCFNHEQQPERSNVSTKSTDSMRTGTTQKYSMNESTNHAREDAKDDNTLPTERPIKRRKIVSDTLPVSKAEKLRAQVADARLKQTAQPQRHAQPVPADAVVEEVAPPKKQSTLKRSISPPSINSTRAKTAPTSKEDFVQAVAKFLGDKTESLNPRVIVPAPESHSKRHLYCQHIHSHMARLNRSVSTSRQKVENNDSIPPGNYVLSDAALIKLAIDEEESFAKGNSKVYTNVIRNRIAAYSRMTLDDWLEKLKTTIFMGVTAIRKTQEKVKSVADVEAFDKLSASDKYAVLEKLKASNLQDLAKHGYVFDPPTETMIQDARSSLDSSHRCDRCNSHFQVFPDRDLTTGRLTSNGPCHFHWGRPDYAASRKTDAYTGKATTTYRCCGQELGTPGCSTYPDHVFKMTWAPGLAAVLPFIATPENSNRRKDREGHGVIAVVFDCEMAYTTNGMELIRLTALAFPTKEPLIDVLVRPLGAVIDMNTRFSGVKPDAFSKAKPYDTASTSRELQIVADPIVARSLLCGFLDGDKVPLMGHAIENDLTAVRLCHNNIIDTVLLYPHRRPLPMRNGLKALTKIHLKEDIQMGGSEGHDSFEDAAATSDLILLQACQKHG